LDSLEKGILPITPMERTFNIKHSATDKKITRRQYPITPAYAFTDYRAQGQTI
ncbi:hypothetical protein BV22DRAFT_981641, partial [Leucogyrophana mollusca]